MVYYSVDEEENRKSQPLKALSSYFGEKMSPFKGERRGSLDCVTRCMSTMASGLASGRCPALRL
jgi:hypothetical protein